MFKMIWLVTILLPLLSCNNEGAVFSDNTDTQETYLKDSRVDIPATTYITEDPGISAQNEANEASFYKEQSLYQGKFKMLIPAHFTEMSGDKVAIKYPNASKRPDFVYTNERANVNLTFSHTKLPTAQEDLPEVKEVLSQQLLSANPSDFNSRIEKINGSNYVIFEFVSQAIDSKIYNLMFATDVDGKLLIGTFNCTEVLRSDWEEKAKEMIASARKR